MKARSISVVIIHLIMAVNIYAQTANANIRLWLQADAGTNTTTNGGNITSWSDQGGAGNNPAVTIPSGTVTYNNTSASTGGTFFNYNPSITFNGGYLQYPDAFGVVMNGSAASLYYSLSALNTTPATGVSNYSELHDFSTGSGIIGAPFPSNNSSAYGYSDDFGLTSSGIIFLSYNFYARTGTATEYNLITNMVAPVVYNVANTGAGTAWTARSYVNGQMGYNASGTDAPAYKTAGTLGPVTMFKGDHASTQVLKASASEILLFMTNLPANEKSNVDSYLALKME